MTGALGDWRWYVGYEECDDEMADIGTREAAIEYGTREHKPGESFYIVEARMLLSDEEEMGVGERDSAPFAETRNGQWFTINEDGEAVEDKDGI